VKSNKRVRFSETVSVRETSSKQHPSRSSKRHKPPTPTPTLVHDSEQLPEDDEIAHQAKQARSEKRKQTAEGFAEDDSDDDIAFEAMGEADPSEATAEENISQGVPIEAFNVREELDDGVIDPLSGVVNPRKSRDNEMKDEHWLLDFEEKMKDKRYAARFNISKKFLKQRQDEEAPIEPIDKNLLLNEIANELLWGETVNSAMRRMRPKNNTKIETTPLTTIPHPSSDLKENKLKFNNFLEKVDKAVSVGVSSIYSLSKEEILDLVDSMDTKSQWEYKWTNDDTVYGPMSGESMLEWSQQGYFVDSPEYGPVLVRKVPSEDFISISSIDFTE